MEKQLLFLDTETTGKEKEDRLLQVAYQIGDRTVNELFKPPVPINLVAMSVHHVTEAMVAGKVPFMGSTTYNDLTSLAADPATVFVAHNAAFDLAMLAKEGITFPKYICTYKVAYWLDDPLMANHQLQYLRYYFGLEVDLGGLKAHDALADILVLKHVYECIELCVSAKLFEKEEPSVKEIPLQKTIDLMIDISSKPLLYKRLPFGKYEYNKTKLTIADIAMRDRNYLMWLLEQKMAEPAETRDVNWIYTLNHYLKI